MTDPVILVGRRPDGGRRDLLWAYCKSAWAPLGWPISVGYHEADEGPWSLAVASNRASALAGDWEVALYVGADVVVGCRDQATGAVEAALERCQLVFAHDHYYSLSEEGTAEVLAGAAPHGRMNEWPDHGPWTNTFSSVLAVPRGIWEKVGGFDERFRGWGFEDLAFLDACAAAGAGFHRVTGPVFHLWHERRLEDREGGPLHETNRLLWDRYRNARMNWPLMQGILSEAGGPLDV